MEGYTHIPLCREWRVFVHNGVKWKGGPDMKMYNNYFAIATDVLLNTEIYKKKRIAPHNVHLP